MVNALATCDLATPLGRVVAEVDAAGGLSRLYFPDTQLPAAGVPPLGGASPRPSADNGSAAGAAREQPAIDEQELAKVPESAKATLLATARQLGAYFAGELRAFDLPLAPAGTPFQLTVWDELARIPYGTTISYAELARRVDARLPPTAAEVERAKHGFAPAAAQPGGSLRIRAVGRANGQNPLWLVLPCHRVLGSGGKLTGYAGGLWRKEWLLKLEGALPDKLPFG